MQPFVASYVLDTTGEEARRRAEALALEQTVELPREAVHQPFVVAEILPEVLEITEIDGASSLVRVAYPAVTSGLDAAQIINVLFGNSSLLPGTRLSDIELPNEMLIAFGGPGTGIGGIREAVRAESRALTCTALKPMGLAPGELAALVRLFARAGVDVIKDDHGLADHPFCPFEERVRACQGALLEENARSGTHALYAPNLIGSPPDLERQMELVTELGVGAVMLEPMLAGVATLRHVARVLDGVVVLAHPALAGATAMAPEMLLGRLFRLFGADAVIYPHHGGRFAFSEERCLEIASRLRGPWGPLRGALPVPAGGMDVERVGELLRFYGRDVMLLIGGSLYLAGEHLEERVSGFVDRVRSGGGPS